MPDITVQGHSVFVQDTVRSMRRTMIFLHGAGGSHRSWRDQWAGLKGTARLVIPDLPGHARSGGGPRGSVADYAGWIREFAAEMGLETFILAGHSMGGAIALQAALSGLPGLEGLVLVGTGARLKVSPVIIEGISGRLREFAPEMIGWMMARGSSDALKEDVTTDVLSTRPAVFLDDFAASSAFDVMGRLPEIRVPALVVVGDDDRLTPLKYAEYMAANIPGAVLKIVRGAGHLVMLEQPVEVNDAIRRFLHALEQRGGR